MSIIWGLIITLLTLVEFATLDIITIWYALGGVVSLMLTFFKQIPSDFPLQLIICIVVGTILSLLFRDKAIKYLNNKSFLPTTDKIVGEEGIVTKEITKNQYGEVKVKNKAWTAYANKKINVGTKVEVLEIDGVKLKVKEKAK